MVQAVRGQDDIAFGLDGSFGFDTPIGPLDIPYDEQGGFPAPRRPEISLKKVKLKDLSLQGVSFDVKLDVDNDHGSNLLFGGPSFFATPNFADTYNPLVKLQQVGILQRFEVEVIVVVLALESSEMMMGGCRRTRR